MYNKDNKRTDKYKLQPIFRNNKIIKLSISKDQYKLNILDSYSLLTKSLAKLCK